MSLIRIDVVDRHYQGSGRSDCHQGVHANLHVNSSNAFAPGELAREEHAIAGDG